MSEDNNNVSRRDALKGIAVGLGTSLPVLNSTAFAQKEGEHAGHGKAAAGAAEKDQPAKPKFFKPEQMALIATISELIIPTDDHSPGAIAAEVPAFTDLMVSESPAEVKTHWTSGLEAIEKSSREKYQLGFNQASKEQQIALLTEISKNEMKPQTPEERFFRTIKNMTIDGYYTSEIGIKKELQYKGNTYLKEFKGCTHPEHQG